MSPLRIRLQLWETAEALFHFVWLKLKQGAFLSSNDVHSERPLTLDGGNDRKKARHVLPRYRMDMSPVANRPDGLEGASFRLLRNVMYLKP